MHMVFSLIFFVTTIRVFSGMHGISIQSFLAFGEHSYSRSCHCAIMWRFLKENAAMPSISFGASVRFLVVAMEGLFGRDPF